MSLNIEYLKSHGAINILLKTKKIIQLKNEILKMQTIIDYILKEEKKYVIDESSNNINGHVIFEDLETLLTKLTHKE